ncbi:MAG: hypothetical protein ACRC33_01255, partial [Gemmataceae bacterium]
MKDSQWAIAVGALAALVFVIVFAGQYLGGDPGGPASRPRDNPAGVFDRELTFATKTAPADGSVIEVEDKGHGEASFFFFNPNAQPVKVGLVRSSCRCTEAELHLLPGDGPGWVAALATAAVGQSGGGPLALAGSHPLGLAALAKAAQLNELKKDKEAVTVPPGAAGWVRMGWHANAAGPLRLEATLWMEDPNLGKRATLEIGTFAHEPFRVRPALNFGTVREADLAAGGVKSEVVVWSATRADFRLAVSPGSVRTDPKSDPLEIGTPVPLTPEERREMERGTGEQVPGGVRSGWKVPLMLKAVAADGKTPLDIGPFRRTLVVSSADVPEVEPKQISLSGRVRGVVEIGSDGEGGDVAFGSFPRKGGRTDSVTLTSEVSGLELTVDAARTSKFLTATIEPPQSVGGTRRIWRLKLTVKPGAATGRFPRKEDALYEDSAVYLIGSAPGQTPRPVRIAVFGTASE